MNEYCEQRKKLLSQYKELTKKLPNKFMNIHFKSINKKKSDIKNTIFQIDFLKSKNKENLINILDPETKSFILNNKNRITSLYNKFHKYSNSLNNHNKKKSFKNRFFNKQTIILTKFNYNINNQNNFNEKEEDIIYKNKDIKFYKNNTFNNTYSGHIYKNIDNNNKISNQQQIKINKEKTLYKTYYNKIKNRKNKKKEIILDKKNKNNDYKDNNNNNNNINCTNENNNKLCQTSFGSFKTLKNTDDNIKKQSSVLNNEDVLNLSNYKMKQNIITYNKKMEINFQNKNYYNTFSLNKSNQFENKKRQNKSFENLNNLKKNIINYDKKTISENGIKLNCPLFTNNSINQSIINTTIIKNNLIDQKINTSPDRTNCINSLYFKNIKNQKMNNKKINLLFIKPDFLENKGNYLYGNNHNFIGKPLKTYQTKNNVFLPNLSLRLKAKLPRYERQLDGFIIA